MKQLAALFATCLKRALLQHRSHLAEHAAGCSRMVVWLRPLDGAAAATTEDKAMATDITDGTEDATDCSGIVMWLRPLDGAAVEMAENVATATDIINGTKQHKVQLGAD